MQLAGGTASMQQLKERLEKDLLEVRFTAMRHTISVGKKIVFNPYIITQLQKRKYDINYQLDPLSPL